VVSERFDRGQFALPHNKHRPADVPKLSANPLVSGYIPLDLSAPKLVIGGGQSGPRATRVTMPVAAVDQDDLLVTRKNDVGLSRQITSVQTEAESQGMQQASDTNLGSGILPADPRHDLATFLGSKYVCHDSDSTLLALTHHSQQGTLAYR
jgi:hypothetical protein